MGTGRKLLAAVCAIAPASLIVYDAGLGGAPMVYAILLGLAGIGLTLRSMTAQVLARGVVWTAALPGAIAVVASLVSGRWPEALMVAIASGAGASLLLARPMLHTDGAREAFAPHRFREWLLAGATAAVTAGISVGMIGALMLVNQHAGGILPLAAGLSLVASAVAVARMRAWGVLLAALTSAVCLLAGLAWHDPRSIVAAIATVPGVLLGLPILVARYAPRQRVVEDVRVRVATEGVLEESQTMSPAAGLRLPRG